MKTEPEQARKLSLPRRLWEGWKQIAQKVGDFQARLILSLFYYVILCPFSLLVRFGSDPLSLKDSTPSGWNMRQEVKGSLMEQATKQF